MKKRKPPVVLATCLVLMLVAVGIMYAPKGGAGDGHDHAAEAAPPPTAETGERPKVTSQQISAMSSRPAAPKDGGAARPKPMMGEGAASIAVPKPTTYKPTPNDSSTSTQWYTNETRK
jgi:hypothetical protein